MVKVFHKNPEGSGLRCGLMFHRGKAVSDEPLTDAQRFHFSRWGFTVEGDAPETPEAPETKTKKTSKTETE